MRRAQGAGPDKAVVESAAAALARLALTAGNKDAIREEGGIPALVALLWADPEMEVRSCTRV